MKKEFLYMCGVLFLSVFVISCSSSGGGGNYGGNTVAFETTTTTGYFESEYYDSDYGVFIDTNDDDVCDAYTFFEDDVIISIDNIELRNLPDSGNIKASDVKIDSYTVELVVHNGDQILTPNPRQVNHFMMIPANSTGNEYPVRILDQDHKINSGYGGGIWKYTVIVRLRVVEVDTGMKETLRVEFPMNFYDIADDC